MFIFACPKMNTKGQPFTWSDFVGLPCADYKERATAESHTLLRGTPPSRLSVFYFSARLCKMALKKLFFVYTSLNERG